MFVPTEQGANLAGVVVFDDKRDHTIRLKEEKIYANFWLSF